LNVGRRGRILVLVELAVLGGVLWLLLRHARGSRPRDLVRLEPNGAWQGKLVFGPKARLDFELAVPADAAVLEVTLACEPAELELYAQPETPVGDPMEATYAVTEPDEPRELVFNCLGPDRLAGTSWYFAAVWPWSEAPRVDGRRLERAPVTLTLRTLPARVDAELVPGEPLRSELDLAGGGLRTFHVRVPEGAAALRLDLFDVSSNLDLYARAGGPILAVDDDVAAAENGWGHETLLIEPGSAPPLAPGDWYVDVVDAVGPTRTLPFSILATLSSDVPAPLRPLPEIPAPGDGPLARALAAVVELATVDGAGSGTILTPDGWILTNAHVLGRDPETPIVVSLSLDSTLPPEECLRAAAVAVDEQRDLALVRVVSGLYGQPLPRGYALPTLAQGDDRRLAIGAPLWLVGYPSTGGTGSRVTISATRGILAGFERADFGVLLKTDAEIALGNSGGAALDEHGLLVGVPSSTVENGSGQIAYVTPISALPAAWREELGR
jgi:hypothetical protein